MSWTRPAVGALSGNFVMDEKRGRPAASLAAYCASVGVVLEQAHIASREGGTLLSTPHPPPSMW